MLFVRKVRPAIVELRESPDELGYVLYVNGKWRGSCPMEEWAYEQMAEGVKAAVREALLHENAKRIETIERAKLAELKAKYESAPETPENR